MDDDHVSSTAAAAGKVVWANEGFERLAGVDAIDVVGHQLDSLFEVGVDEGEELMKSIELSKVSIGEAKELSVFVMFPYVFHSFRCIRISTQVRIGR